MKPFDRFEAIGRLDGTGFDFKEASWNPTTPEEMGIYYVNTLQLSAVIGSTDRNKRRMTC